MKAPNANAHAERFIRTVRNDCLDWRLIFGRRQLERVLREYVDHYNRERPTARSSWARPTPHQRSFHFARQVRSPLAAATGSAG